MCHLLSHVILDVLDVIRGRYISFFEQPLSAGVSGRLGPPAWTVASGRLTHPLPVGPSYTFEHKDDVLRYAEFYNRG